MMACAAALPMSLGHRLMALVITSDILPAMKAGERDVAAAYDAPRDDQRCVPVASA
ncbi:hypothetical protein [Luteimonas sp. SDU101]|uniref:hypothetical protein n=1 Tax=unclassified Luteimonas TaxID=2629088 RepID=UPI003EB7AD46